jgi:Glyoxalase-like domain
MGMNIELDHVFLCASQGAPEADELVRFGLHEGPPHMHPGQGTSCRRFSFTNAMIELLWVSDPQEAQSEATRRTLLWDRWSARQTTACPFGICLRPVDPQHEELPFPAWEYKPTYLPDPLVMHIAESAFEEPMWVHLGFLRRADREEHFTEHPAGIREITGLHLTTSVPLRSAASQRIVASKILSTRTGPKPLLEIEFDGKRRNQVVDFRPHLPIVFRL